MLLNLQRMGPELRRRLAIGWLLAAGLGGLYLSVRPLQQAKEYRNQQATGLSAVRPETFPGFIASKLARREGIAGGVAGGVGSEIGTMQEKAMMGFLGSASDERELLRTSSLEVVVNDPAAAAEKIRQLAEHNGGYLVSSQIQGSAGNASAALTVRVPGARFEEVRTEIRKLGLRVESDKLEAQDVTKDYVDREARLRNLHAQEQQYLQILKRAATVKDTLEVSDKLNQVRSQIEQQQAEFQALAKQTETVAIAVDLRSDADAQVLGLHWRPLYRIKQAMREGLDGLGDYVASMTSFAFLLPSVLLWLMTFVVGASVGWRLLRWVARVFFNFPKAAVS
jgi:uncharacterized protein DUF4349